MDKEAVTIISGTHQDLDIAYAFCRGTLYSIYGAEEGENLFQTMPALVGIALYAWALHNVGEA